jgi:predicted transcriptional regulator of viral defense system
VTTDAALVFHGFIDQPLTTVTVVVPRPRRRIDIGGTVVRPVTLSPERLRSAERYATSLDGFGVHMATREQAVIDAVAEPQWMVHGDLLPEVLSAFSREELEQVSSRALARSTAAGHVA